MDPNKWQCTAEHYPFWPVFPAGFWENWQRGITEFITACRSFFRGVFDTQSEGHPKPIGAFVSSWERNLSEAPMMSEHISKRIFFFWLWMVFGWLSSKTQRQSRAPVFGIGAVWSSMNGTFWVDEIVTWPSTSINTTQWFEAPTPVDIEQDWQRFGIQFWSFFWTKHGWCLVARPEATWIYITYENLWFFLICSVYLLIISSFFAGFSHDSASIFVGDGLIQGAVMFGRTPGDIATASLTVLWRSCLRRQRDCWGS